MDKIIFEQNFTSWTDDIPICRESGVGSSANEVYKPDGGRLPNGLHSFEDRSFRFKKEEYGLCLYGVFDGFNGGQVADFVMKRLPAELLLGQMGSNIPPEMVREQLKQSFVCVDREYFGSIGDRLAARMVIRSEERPGREAQLAELEDQVSSGCVACVALVMDHQLYLANVGDCSAFLVQITGLGGLAVTPLSVEHTMRNEDERLRLKHLGFTGDSLGGHGYTRCFGNYPVKGGYKEYPTLHNCRDEPVIAEPEVQGPIEVGPGDEFRLLILATRSLLNAVEMVTGGEAREELAGLVNQHLRDQPRASLSTVSQACIDYIVRMMAEQAEVDSSPGLVCREDITLLIRTFSPAGVTLESGAGAREEKTLTTRSSARPARPTRSSTTTESSGVYLPLHGRELAVDENGRIEPYVDFAPFYKLWNQRSGVTTMEES